MTDKPSIQLELYVQGQASRSAQAIARVRAMGDIAFGGDYRLEVIDVQDQVARVREAGVMVTPTLVRRWPEPVLRTVAPLTEERLRRGMGLDG